MNTYGGQQIWGTRTRQGGPFRPYRAMRSQLPSVDGARVYRIGKDPRVWTVRGRLFANGLASLNSTILSYQALADGQTRTFNDAGGASHSNCILTRYGPVGAFQVYADLNGQSRVTVEVEGVVECLAPTT